MELRQLRYFAAIYETGSLSAASSACRVAQSALSYQLANLEEELGVALFERQPRGMWPTVEGDRFYDHARRILKAVGDAEADVKAQAAGVSGAVTLGLPYTALEMIGLPLMERAQEAYPDVQLWIAESLSSQAFASLLSGEIDFALLYNPPAGANIRVETLLTEELKCIGRPEIIGTETTPMAFDDVAALPQLMLRHGDAARAIVEDPKLLDRIVRRSRVQLISINMLRKALEAGLGCAVAPPATIQTILRGEALVTRPIVDPVITRRLCLARLTTMKASRATEAIAGLVRTLIAEEVDTGRWKATLA